jgi:hypothetical protein
MQQRELERQSERQARYISDLEMQQRERIGGVLSLSRELARQTTQSESEREQLLSEHTSDLETQKQHISDLEMQQRELERQSESEREQLLVDLEMQTQHISDLEMQQQHISDLQMQKRELESELTRQSERHTAEVEERELELQQRRELQDLLVLAVVKQRMIYSRKVLHMYIAV